MRFQRLASFDKAYRRLGASDQKRFDAALKRFAENPSHPSLHVERVTNTNLWSFRASLHIRCTFESENPPDKLGEDDVVVLRNVGRHDDVYRSP